MAKLKRKSSPSEINRFASAGFGAVLGGLGAMALVGIVCITLFGLGYYLLVTYNKPGTKLFKELQPMQYVGIFLCALACLPFIQYFFLGFLAEGGSALFSNMFE